jgi:hypothetical protein
MQTFRNTLTQEIFALDDDVQATGEKGARVFIAAHGEKLELPATLEPCEAPPQLPVDPAADARARRDALLEATDWTQLQDVPEATRARYVTYRQELRDMPEQSGFPNTIKWPISPQ